MSVASNSTTYAAFANVEFRFFLAMRMCITLAIQMQAVVVAWQVFELSHKDPLALGLIGLAEAIPYLSMALFAGYWVDVMSRRLILIRGLSVLFATALLLWLFSLPALSNWVANPLYIIFTLIFLTGLARSFIAPAHFAILTQIVKPEELPSAIAWNSTNWQVAAVCGPALGGLLYGWVGLSATYFIQFILIGLAFFFCLLIRPKPVPPAEPHESMFAKIQEGLQFVFGNTLILASISLDLFAVLFGGAVALLPAFADTILHVGAQGLGFLRAAPAMGAVAMAIVLAYYPVKKQAGVVLLACVAGFGLCIIGFGLSTSFWLSMAMLFLSGVFDSVSVVIRSVILQHHTPENMKGRVSAVNNIFIGSSNEIGAFESGVAAKLLGLVPSVVFGGCMTLLVVGITHWKATALRKLNL
ncbi:MAG TPA: MFS transporter [Microscillaceae bacterium]|nr:MFS transporter [Microscillaceae bacterium]